MPTSLPRYIVGTILLVAGVSKLANLGDFRHTLMLSGISNDLLLKGIVFGTPALETVVGFMLLVRKSSYEASIFACSLSLIFLVVTLWNPGQVASCHCIQVSFVEELLRIHWVKIAFNVVLLGLSVLSLRSSGGELELRDV